MPRMMPAARDAVAITGPFVFPETWVGIAPSDVRAVHSYLLCGDIKIVLPGYRLADAGGVYMLYRTWMTFQS